MTALDANYKTREQIGEKNSDPCAAAVHVFKGALVVLDSSGNAKPAVTGTGLIARGVATAECDNSAGSAGDLDVESKPGIFGFANSASSDEIAAAEIGDACYIVDDRTVAKTSGGGTRSVAGKVIRIEGGQVYVQVGPVASVDGDLVAANNLSDVASAATARANLGANKGELFWTLPSLSVAAAHRMPLPDRAVTITKIKTVIDAALTVGDAVVTFAINTTNITGGAVTITQSGSAAGDQDEVSPSAANVSAGANDYLRATVSGTNTADIPCQVCVEYTW